MSTTDEAGQALDWGYGEEDGPEHWGDLNSAYALCAIGRSQSPIDIRNPVSQEAAPPRFDYHGEPLSIINNGHTVQINIHGESLLRIDGKRYHLRQYHFHTPSEHTIGGRHAPMEIHLVHRTPEQGELAVVAVLVERGGVFPALASVWEHLPEKPGPEQRLPEVVVNPDLFLPELQRCYRYSGSLTTPPCTEGVRWLVFTEPLVFSDDQIDAMVEIVGQNNRPVQPLHGRLVTRDG